MTNDRSRFSINRAATRPKGGTGGLRLASQPRIPKYLDPSVRRHKPDYLMLTFMIILLLLGMIVIYSIGPALASKRGLDQNHYMYRQIAYLLIAGLAFFITSRIPFRWWAKLQPVLAIGAIISCLLLLVPGLGKQVYGATRWIALGPVQFQPAELVKFALIFYLARLFVERMRDGSLNDIRQTVYPFGIVMVLVGITVAVLQKDLGTMIAVAILMLTMIYFAGLSLRNMSIIMFALGLGTILMIAMFPHRLSRITTFLHPNENVDGSSYQMNQALIAVGSGGLVGKGIGRSVQAYGYLPEAANDSIFAILSEKLGFFGTTIVIGLFGALLWRMLRIVKLASSSYTQLLVAGVFGWVAAHIVVNIGAILGLLPLTGITLPFISFGGSSLVFILSGLGIVFHVSRYTHHESNYLKEATHESFASGRRLGRARHTPARSGV